MAQFRATIKGTRGEASRLGSKNSGIRADVNGWNSGIKVLGYEYQGQDVFEVWKTGGSNGAGSNVKIAEVRGDQIIILHKAGI